jgi:transcriptional regulator with GAF, ATPase, and Fis domain
MAQPQTQRLLEDLQRIATELVGVCVHDVQDTFRRAMLTEALRRVDGNLTQAATLLGVKRQAVQYMMAKYELRTISVAAAPEALH